MGHPVLAPYELTWEDLRLAGLDAAFPPADLPLEVEIGCGDDDFLLRSAEQRPGTRWLGIEYSHKRVRRQIRCFDRESRTLQHCKTSPLPQFLASLPRFLYL